MQKNFLSLTVFCLIIICLFSSSCGNKEEEKKEVEIVLTKNIIEGDTAQSIASLNIEGMTCEVGCAGFITSKLSQMTGVLSAEVVFDKNLAKVKFDDSKITENDIIAAIQKLNEGQYKVTKVEVEKTVKKSIS